MMTYTERFPPTEKTFRKRKVGTTQAIENSLSELQKIADSVGDDYIKDNIESLIEDICTEKEICFDCFSKIDEVWYDEELVRQCNCKSKRLAV